MWEDEASFIITLLAQQGGDKINNLQQQREVGVHGSLQQELPDKQFPSPTLPSEICTRLSISIPGFSRLSSADALFFREFFQKEEVCYANSWLYLLRAARDDQGDFGYKFLGKEMIAAIGYRDHSFYVVHPLGVKRYAELLELCMQLYNACRTPVILKKIDQPLYDQLSETALFGVIRNDPSLFEEEAFPEHILQLERLFVVTSETKPRLQPFLKKVQRFERQNKLWAVQNVAWKELESNPGFPKLFGYNTDKYKSYVHVIKEALLSDRDEGRYRVCAYYDERGTIHGLYVGELFEQGIMGLYCAVSARSFPGITEWMDYNFFQQLFHEGIQRLYLGGSETEGVHAYIQKLLPIVPTYSMRPLLMYRNGANVD